MRAEKQYLLDGVKEKIEASNAMVVMSYKSLDPNKAAALRFDMDKSGGNFAVVPKRVFIKAAETAGLTFKREDLQGHIAIAFAGDDTVGPTKVVFDDDYKDHLEVLMGHFNGSNVSAEDVKEISKLPSRDEMRAQLLSVFEAPMTQMLGVVESLLTSVPHALENKANKES